MSAQVREASVQNGGFTYLIFHVFILLNFFHVFIFEESSQLFFKSLVDYAGLATKIYAFYVEQKLLVWLSQCFQALAQQDEMSGWFLLPLLPLPLCSCFLLHYYPTIRVIILTPYFICVLHIFLLVFKDILCKQLRSFKNEQLLLK